MQKTVFFLLILGLTFFLAACGQEDKEKTPLKKISEEPMPRVVTMQPDGPPVQGNPAPDFTLTDIEGRTWTLSQLKGQVVFLNFWATWCPPCVSEMPSMQNLYNTLPQDQFKMLAVLYGDEARNAKDFAQQLDITLPILIDEGNQVGMNYGITGVPETFILDKEGIIREKVQGPAEWDSAEAIHMIRQYIEQ
ncbi:MAG: redoxin domain-containing protein [Candidatus Electrothrix sp. GW3-4]|uniref:redoxin domain-containing protein n=1 Tax=Candidatus Electrothrix sp. GW3-4 TaxID=3126740 RepID=UPI0030D3CB8C